LIHSQPLHNIHVLVHLRLNYCFRKPSNYRSSTLLMNQLRSITLVNILSDNLHQQYSLGLSWVIAKPWYEFVWQSRSYPSAILVSSTALHCYTLGKATLDLTTSELAFPKWDVHPQSQAFSHEVTHPKQMKIT